MDETDRPDDRRAAGSWLPHSESRLQKNHEPPKSGIPKRKKTETRPRLSCKIEHLPRSNQSNRSIASQFFTGDYRKYRKIIKIRAFVSFKVPLLCRLLQPHWVAVVRRWINVALEQKIQFAVVGIARSIESHVDIARRDRIASAVGDEAVIAVWPLRDKAPC